MKKGSTLSAIFLIIGTTIGAGMASLPIVTGLAGFYPALLMSVLVWLVLLATGLLYLEAVLALPDGANVYSISRRLLGPFGTVIGVATFIFLLYTAMVVYFVNGVPLVLSFFQNAFGLEVSKITGYAFFGLFFLVLIALGIRPSDYVNQILVIGLLITFCIIISIGFHHISAKHLNRMHWIFLPLSAPALLNAFGYQPIIPTIATFLKRDVRALRLTLILGTFIPLVVYIIWQAIVIGSLDEGTIWVAYETSAPVARGSQLVRLKYGIGDTVFFLSFFAITTSLITMSLAMVDFFSDILKIKVEDRKGWNRFLLCLAMFPPSAFFGYIAPQTFSAFLKYGGGFACAILFGIIPVWMSWSVRYKENLPGPRLLPGGRPLLLSLLFVIFFILYLHGLEIIQ